MTDAERGWATTPDPVEGTVRFRIHGAVAEFLLHRPAKRNALTPTMLEALHDACRELARNDSVRVVVVRGAGSAFSAGADLGIFSELTPAEIGGAWTRSGQEAFAALAGLPAVTVAVLSGTHSAGGTSWHCTVIYGSPRCVLGRFARGSPRHPARLGRAGPSYRVGRAVSGSSARADRPRDPCDGGRAPRPC